MSDDQAPIVTEKLSQKSIRLLWSPGALPFVAASCSLARAALAGTLILAAELSLAITAQVSGAGEPFADFKDYAEEGFRTVVPAYLFVAVVFGVLALLLVLSARLMPSRRWHAIIKALLLCPVVFLIPVLVWSVFAWLNCAADPNFQFWAYAQKPSWLSSPIIAIIGSPVWVPAGFVLLIAHFVRALPKLNQFLADLPGPRCLHCDYLLLGLTVPRCPECGHAFDPALLVSAKPISAEAPPSSSES